MVLLVAEGLTAVIAFGPYHSHSPHGCSGLKVRLGSSSWMEMPCTSTTQKLGRFSIPPKHLNILAVVGTTSASHIAAGIISATTICLSAIPSRRQLANFTSHSARGVGKGSRRETPVVGACRVEDGLGSCGLAPRCYDTVQPYRRQTRYHQVLVRVPPSSTTKRSLLSTHALYRSLIWLCSPQGKPLCLSRNCIVRQCHYVYLFST
jgi:hypothetical protein